MTATTIKIYNKDIIAQITHALINENDAFEGYVKVVKLAQSLGINIILATFEDDTIAGMLKFENNEVNIYVNEKQSANRQRFTIAHELGHFILHKNLVENQKGSIFYRKDFDNYSDALEQQANQFAASLLMPERVIKELWDVFHSIDPIADILRVSKQALLIRMTALGVING